ncbi:GSCOCG00010451001-RA-CDS [Cotesia congregata]|uniref:Protein SHQ1 homolog n=1 Tax=Cotesia congregata TaxID=51543 RepID=A0A8J2H8Q3_COTCN|nr:GSCOCG00010451001-RA-CDS [Cotesia congregata]CAG5085415.1 Similar to Shq1: Protein SHQ1 homolog (Mus musculus) [Cotesia congregata]
MLTPRFELTQDDKELTINIYAPYANIKDTEVYVEKTDFRFFSSPYYLRLKLPGEIVENDKSFGSYDCDTGKFLFRFSKVTPGEHFDNLDMITTLLAPSKKKENLTANIEVIGNPAVANECLDENSSSDEWYMPQKPAGSSLPINILMNAPKYGFGNKISNALGPFEEGWLKDVVDLPTPDSTLPTMRSSLRESDELNNFSDDHYTADLFQPQGTMKAVLEFTPSWRSFKPEEIEFTDHEKDILKELPNKEFLLESQEIQAALYGLVDIMFSSSYNHRVTTGENTSESSWDINKLSGTLCWFESYSSMDQVVKTSVRRSLCYPIYRNWELSIKVLEDVKAMLKLGKKFVVKRLCEVYDLFNNSYEPRYVLNQLYIRDYLIWLQQAPENVLDSLVEELEAVEIKKEDLGLDLVELEAAGWSVLEEEKKNDDIRIDIDQNFPEYFVNSVVDGFGKLELKDQSESDTDTDSSSDSDSDTDTDSDSDSDSTDPSEALSLSSTEASSSDDEILPKKYDDLDSDDLTEEES